MEAFRDQVVPEKKSCVRMEAEKVSITRSKLQITEEAVRKLCLIEWGSSEGHHEEQDAKGEDVGLLSLAWILTSVVEFGGHILASTHLLIGKYL